MKKSITIILTILIVLATMIGLSMTIFAQDTAEGGAIPVPEIPNINRPYKTAEELGIDLEAIDAYFPKEIEVRYEGSRIYVEDIGVGAVSVFVSKLFNLELVDGYWTAEIEGEAQFIYLFPFEELKGNMYWQVIYYGNGTREAYISLNDEKKNVYMTFSNEAKIICVLYFSGDYSYEDTYRNGTLYTHEVSNENDTESVNKAVYDVNGGLAYCALLTDTYYYYFPNQGWSSEATRFVACEAPKGYEGFDEADFAANKPPLICSSATGNDIIHDYIGKLVASPTCTSVGEMTYTCSRNSAHAYTEQLAIDENAHDWDSGAVTTQPTCTKKGVKTYTCAHNSEHTRTEEIEATGHAYDNACDADCNKCGEARIPAEHYSENKDGKCDECGKSFELSGGAIAGIVSGIVAILGGGGFALYWFVIRKKIIK